jgi:quercetin dioxygenase-like cupin family protein
MAAYSIARLDEIEEIDDGRAPFRPVRHHFGITSFGVNAFTGKAVGDRIINEHDEADEHEELYIVTSGRATFELDGDRVDAPAGTLVFAEPGVKRTAFAEEPGTTLVALGGQPGQAYHVHGYETWSPLQSLYVEGKYDEVIERGRTMIEASGFAMPLYNLACCEALAGHKQDAIGHLRTSLELAPEQLVELAKKDTDLDALRDEAEFQQLLAR